MSDEEGSQRWRAGPRGPGRCRGGVWWGVTQMHHLAPPAPIVQAAPCGPLHLQACVFTVQL